MGILAISWGSYSVRPYCPLPVSRFPYDPYRSAYISKSLCNIRLDQFHHLREQFNPVRYQQDFQTVLCHLAGAFSCEKNVSYSSRPLPMLSEKYRLLLSKKILLFRNPGTEFLFPAHDPPHCGKPYPPGVSLPTNGSP